MVVNPPGEVGVCVIVDSTTDGEVGDVEDCGVDEGVDDELEEMGVEEELDDSDVLVCEVEEELMGRLVEEEMVEESEVETGVGLLLAIELDDIEEELAGTVGAAVEDDAREEVVLVELEPDIVNCLPKTSFLGCL